MGRAPDIRVLTTHTAQPVTATPAKPAAIDRAVASYRPQWSFWPLGADVETRLRHLLETRFDELFSATPDGYAPAWITPGREVLITWRPGIDRRA